MAQFSRTYTIVNVSPTTVQGMTDVDGDSVQYTKHVVLVEAHADKPDDGTLKLVLTGDERNLIGEFTPGKTISAVFTV